MLLYSYINKYGPIHITGHVCQINFDIEIVCINSYDKLITM